MKSDPPGAQVTLLSCSIRATTDQTIDLTGEVFGDRKVKNEKLYFEKEGFRSQTISATLRADEENRTNPEVVRLEPLDTTIVVESEPSNAFVRLDASDQRLKEILGLTDDEYKVSGWAPGFVTPKTFECTSEEAKRLADSLRIAEVELQGFWPSPRTEAGTTYRPGSTIRLRPGERNTVTILLEPIVTTLRVMTEPEGATVEDQTEAGFGYLGETPVTRNFNWEDITVWAERKGILRDRPANKLVFEVLQFHLKISKNGHLDEVFEVKIPVGEERAFKRNLKPVPTRIAFDSDPAGANVYVVRHPAERRYDASTNSYRDVAVAVKKYLGTTPFALSPDPSDPLIHGEDLIFEKPEYESRTAYYAQGTTSYHVTLQPKEPAKEK